MIAKFAYCFDLFKYEPKWVRLLTKPTILHNCKKFIGVGFISAQINKNLYFAGNIF